MASKNKIIEGLSFYFQNSKCLAKTRAQYKLDFFLVCFAVFIREATGIIIVYMALQRFDHIGGWNLNELFFLFSLIFLTYSVLVFLFSGIRDFSSLVQTGKLDRNLLRPRRVLFQIIAENSDYFASVGHGTLGIILFVLSANSIGVQWTIPNILYLIITIIGGILIQASIWLIFSCSSFFMVQTDNLKDFLYWNTRKFAGYPLSIYPSWIQNFLKFVIPFAFVNYFPAQYFLRKEDMSNYPTVYMYLTPLIGIVMFIAVLRLWRFSLKHYTSTGS